jgi:hypothetical protein
MAKSKKKVPTITLYDDEPNPFAMSAEEYEKAQEEYYQKAKAQEEKIEKWQKANHSQNDGKA